MTQFLKLLAVLFYFLLSKRKAKWKQHNVDALLHPDNKEKKNVTTERILMN